MKCDQVTITFLLICINIKNRFIFNKLFFLLPQKYFLAHWIFIYTALELFSIWQKWAKPGNPGRRVALHLNRVQNLSWMCLFIVQLSINYFTRISRCLDPLCHILSHFHWAPLYCNVPGMRIITWNLKNIFENFLIWLLWHHNF